MGKCMIVGTYTANGAKGVLSDWYVIVDLPDNAAAAAISLVGTASGTLRSRAIALITPEGMDAVAGRSVDFRPPGA
jgi:hypothetical protein